MDPKPNWIFSKYVVILQYDTEVEVQTTSRRVAGQKIDDVHTLSFTLLMAKGEEVCMLFADLDNLEVKFNFGTGEVSVEEITTPGLLFVTKQGLPIAVTTELPVRPNQPEQFATLALRAIPELECYDNVVPLIGLFLVETRPIECGQKFAVGNYYGSRLSWQLAIHHMFSPLRGLHMIAEQNRTYTVGENGKRQTCTILGGVIGPKGQNVSPQTTLVLGDVLVEIKQDKLIEIPQHQTDISYYAQHSAGDYYLRLVAQVSLGGEALTHYVTSLCAGPVALRLMVTDTIWVEFTHTGAFLELQQPPSKVELAVHCLVTDKGMTLPIELRLLIHPDMLPPEVEKFLIPSDCKKFRCSLLLRAGQQIREASQTAVELLLSEEGIVPSHSAKKKKKKKSARKKHQSSLDAIWKGAHILLRRVLSLYISHWKLNLRNFKLHQSFEFFLSVAKPRNDQKVVLQCVLRWCIATLLDFRRQTVNLLGGFSLPAYVEMVRQERAAAARKMLGNATISIQPSADECPICLEDNGAHQSWCEKLRKAAAEDSDEE